MHGYTKLNISPKSKLVFANIQDAPTALSLIMG